MKNDDEKSVNNLPPDGDEENWSDKESKEVLPPDDDKESEDGGA